MKLTKAQLTLLEQIKGGPTHVVDYYPPAKKLIEMGLATRDARNQLKITDAGSDAIARQLPQIADGKAASPTHRRVD